MLLWVVEVWVTFIFCIYFSNFQIVYERHRLSLQNKTNVNYTKISKIIKIQI